jgi:y4mF family transcriptional regulator
MSGLGPFVSVAISDIDELAKLVRSRRRAAGLSQQQLAEAAGTGRRFVSDLEGGKKTVQLVQVLLVLGALGIGLEAAPAVEP